MFGWHGTLTAAQAGQITAMKLVIYDGFKEGLSDYLHARGRSHFMFELLVPPTPGQLSRSGGDKKDYDRGLRPGLMVQAITELQATGTEPDVWKEVAVSYRGALVLHRPGRGELSRRPRRLEILFTLQ